MRLLIVSDTHGRLSHIREALSRMADVDMLIHLGDYEEDAMTLSEEYGLDVISVPGNMDGCGDREEGDRVLVTEWGNILLTHGHLYDVKWDSTRLLYAAEENGCRAVFFGHTHAALYEERDGITLLNPGSAALPRDGNPPSYAIVRTSEERLECGICYMREPHADSAGGEGARPGRTGHLSSLLNYSDRF